MPPVNKRAFEKFLAVYREELAKAVQEHPDQYAYGLDEVEAVANRMATALRKGSYNHSGFAFRGTCRRLGIPHTRTAISLYIATPKEENEPVVNAVVQMAEADRALTRMARELDDDAVEDARQGMRQAPPGDDDDEASTGGREDIWRDKGLPLYYGG